MMKAFCRGSRITRQRETVKTVKDFRRTPHTQLKVGVNEMVLVLGFVCARGAQAQYVDGIQAIVHESPVTYIEVAEVSRPAVESMQRQFSGREEDFRRQVSEVMSNNLDHLVNNQLI